MQIVELETEEICTQINHLIDGTVTEKLHALHEEPQLGGKNYNKLHTEEELMKYLESAEDYAALVRHDVRARFPLETGMYQSVGELMLHQARMLLVLARVVSR
jgi:hypothetical protein